ncbi:PAS domain S-box-containing protein/diguanylate cyclase (GGDEF)-like protein [Aestuariispira insulae]|uniref:PAS domain S-box-containing protein/diguanylate cyclase (GGDEF)-like protein n=2 Tax=Aestuariispira insulae TaxID=1461337 RepID=A0A3D9HVP0_9PROT|nr:PAS domain S-box-containing protein/diguanylate cyclase (GGDEF)-like protein [Aestuariispira insulae]
MEVSDLWDDQKTAISFASHQQEVGEILDIMPVGLLVQNRHSILYSNCEAARLLGCSQQELVGKHCMDFISGKVRERLISRFMGLFHGGDTLRETGLKIKAADNGRNIIQFVAGTLPSAEGELVQVFIQDLSYLTELEKDISARKRAEKALQHQTAVLEEQQADFRVAQKLGKIGSYKWDVICNHLVWSDELYRILGYDPAKMVPTMHALRDVVDDQDAALLLSALEKLEKSGVELSEQYRIKDVDGEEHWVHERAVATFTASGELSLIRGTIQDVTNRKLREDYIRQQTYFDQQTGLPNRQSLHDKLSELCAGPHRRGSKVYVIQVVIEDFRRIYDAMGVGAENKLIDMLAPRLRSCVPECYMLARLEGGEFMIVMDGIREVKEVEACIHRIQSILCLPMELETRRVALTSSIGVASFPDDGDTADALLQYVDTATTVAASGGLRSKSSVSLFNRAMADDIARRLDMEHLLWQGMQNQEFEMYFQPQIDMQNGQICGAEALIRWHSATLGPVSPAEFIPIAEETGLIIELGKWILAEACRVTRTCLDLVDDSFRMGVNVSPVQFQDRDLPRQIARCIEQFELPADSLEVEITEGVLIDPSLDSHELLPKIKALGVHLSLDDFGTGYSSISYLQRMKFDTLKVDQSFVRDICTDSDTRVIVRSIVAMAKRLSMSVIMEGVEEQAQYELLRSFNSDRSQGYFHAKPMPEQDFLEFARTIAAER